MSGLFDSIQDNTTLDTSALESLEAKVSQVIDRLRDLQADKQRLEQQVTMLREQCQESARRIEELTSERDLLRANQRDHELEEMLRARIRALLDKLEAVQ